MKDNQIYKLYFKIDLTQPLRNQRTCLTLQLKPVAGEREEFQSPIFQTRYPFYHIM